MFCSFIFLIYTYLYYLIHFNILLLVVASEVLAEVDCSRRGCFPALDCCGTWTEWQQLWLPRPDAWMASKAPLYERRCGGQSRDKRLQKLTVWRPAWWYVFSIMFVYLVGPIHHFTSVFCCHGSSGSSNGLATEVWPLQSWEGRGSKSGRSKRAETETHFSIFCSLYHEPAASAPRRGEEGRRDGPSATRGRGEEQGTDKEDASSPLSCDAARLAKNAEDDRHGGWDGDAGRRGDRGGQ